jgi:protoporphyrinogen oxidase
VATPDGEGRVSDPWRRPGKAWETLRAPIGTLGDKLRVGALRLAATRGDDEAMWRAGNGVAEKRIHAARTTAEELARRGFSPKMTERFLRPWLGGIFLERELTTPAEMLFFVYRMFARGVAALPAGGMQRIPEQLAAGLKPGTLRLGARVAAVRQGEVKLVSGETLTAREVVVATEAGAGLTAEPEPVRWRGVTCVQWAAEASPLGGEPMLWLNGTGRGRVNNVVVPSDVAEAYAPKGRALVSTTVVDPSAAETEDAILVAALREELAGYFGAGVRDWRALAVQRIPQSLPALRVPSAGSNVQRRLNGAWICGDHMASASLQGAMASGQAVAEALLRRG